MITHPLYSHCSASLKYVFFVAAFTLLATTNLQAKNSGQNGITQGRIVVSIKPLYSLVAHLTQGVEEPVLLMKQSQSPHHYNIRPSERRLLANAKMIIWIGPEMGSALGNIIQQSTATIVTASQADDLGLLESRGKHGSHDEHSMDAEDSSHHSTDPHIWLSTRNAAAISTHISQQLIANDPSNTKKYQANLQRLLDKIEHTKRFIKTTLQNVSKPYIAYHDAFQYFEDENELNFVAAINTDDETSVSLKHMREIKEKIEQQQINCLVYQPPKSAIVNSLEKRHDMHTAVLDILGQTVKNDNTAWFEIMQLLALNFNRCLSGK